MDAKQEVSTEESLKNLQAAINEGLSWFKEAARIINEIRRHKGRREDENWQDYALRTQGWNKDK